MDVQQVQKHHPIVIHVEMSNILSFQSVSVFLLNAPGSSSLSDSYSNCGLNR